MSGSTVASMPWTDFHYYAQQRGLQLIDGLMHNDIGNLFFAKYGRRDSQMQCGAGSHTNTCTTGATARLGMQDTVTAGTTWVNAGTVREAFGDPAGGLAYFERARVNYEKNLPANDGRLGGLYNNMALSLAVCGQYDEAMEMFRKAISVMKTQEHGELEQAITWLNMADAAEAKLGAENAEATVEEYLDKAEELLNTRSLPQNGYYAFVCEKCAPVFGHYGWFATEAELRRRAEEINDRS